MTEDQLRSLERRFRERGDLEDEVAWLSARRRVGDLSDARLRLAAFCGHAGARRVAGEGAGPPEAGLPEERDARARCGLTVARSVFPLLRSLPDGLQSPGPDGTEIGEGDRDRWNETDRWLLEAAEALLLAESSPGWLEPAAVARERLLAIGFLSEEQVRDPRDGLRRELMPAWAALKARTLCSADSPEPELRHLAASAAFFHGVAWAFPEVPDSLAEALNQARRALGGPGAGLTPPWPPALEASLLAEVAPWALGYGDPLADRLSLERAHD